MGITQNTHALQSMKIMRIKKSKSENATNEIASHLRAEVFRELRESVLVLTNQREDLEEAFDGRDVALVDRGVELPMNDNLQPALGLVQQAERHLEGAACNAISNTLLKISFTSVCQTCMPCF